MILQLVFFTVCLLDSLQEIVNKKSYFKRLRNFMFKSLAFPIGTFVFFSFWLIYAIDRELVFPTRFDAIIPSWHNHIMHTLPVIGTWIECYLNEYKYEKSAFFGVVPTFLAAFAYLIWMLIVRKFGGIWVYPLMNVLTNFQKFFVILIFFAIVGGFYRLGQFLNEYFWPKHSIKNTKSKKN
ncbi:unnamed protein product [Brachionus calyciflorus]|uniref:Androgen-dependent TFPI-regulating protein n=1 Tax=Brachionus calyciflorus TaxID=104777 RepID=A0A813X153_9BILA|nr:unnamed protein product [Brachionus calyciflorus]